MDCKMPSFSRKRSNKGSYIRLNTIPATNDASTNDVMYYNTCWIIAKKETNKTN